MRKKYFVCFLFLTITFCLFSCGTIKGLLSDFFPSPPEKFEYVPYSGITGPGIQIVGILDETTTKISFPDKIEGLPVVAIDGQMGMAMLKQVSLPRYLEYIGPGTFALSSWIEKVDFSRIANMDENYLILCFENSQAEVKTAIVNKVLQKRIDNFVSVNADLLWNVNIKYVGRKAYDPSKKKVKMSGMVKINGGVVDYTGFEETIKDFYICDHEVTQEEFMAVMGDYEPRFLGKDLPADSVTWYQALEFCNTLSAMNGYDMCYDIDFPYVNIIEDANGFRLPTEIEWRYAASGGDKTRGYIYSGSSSLENVGWYNENAMYKNADVVPVNNENVYIYDFNALKGFLDDPSMSYVLLATHKVKSKKANELGLYDMSGNVWEWCYDDFYVRSYAYGQSMDKVIMGGCYEDYADGCAVYSKSNLSPSVADGGTGFRVARNAT